MPLREKIAKDRQPKYLVVDDLIAPNKTYRENFVARIKTVPLEKFLFASNYEEAKKQIKSASNIILCFVDCIIPKNKKEEGILEKVAEDSQKKDSPVINNLRLAEWGIKIISENQDLKMFPISAHLDSRELRRLAEQYKNVVNTAEKPLKSRALDSIRAKYIEPYYPQTITVKSSPSNLGLSNQKLFDYSSLDERTVSFVQEKTQEIKRLVRRTSQDIIDIGTYLIEVKNRLGHGNFYNWLDAEFDWSYASAARFMGVANRFESRTVRDLDIMPTALYELASSSVPEEAVTEAIEIAKTGEIIDKKTAKAIKAKYKALKEQTGSAVQPQNVEQAESSQAEIREKLLPPVDSVSQSFSSLPEKDRPKQEILGVVPSENAVKNSWWQLGEHHRLFCGEPKAQDFFKNLPKDIALVINFLPKNDLSLVPEIESNSTLTFHSKYEDLDLDSLIEDYISTATRGKELVVFNYLYYVEILNLTESLNSYFWVAEPDLKKCERILTIWRKKGSVMRIA